MMDAWDTGDILDTGDIVDSSPDISAIAVLTADAAAAVLGISARQVRRYGTDGTLSVMRTHGRTRYRADEVARLAAARGLVASGNTVPLSRVGAATNTDAPDIVDIPDLTQGAFPDGAAKGNGPRVDVPDVTAASPMVTVDVGDMAIKALSQALCAAHEETRRLIDELGAARHEVGLWEGRARTLEERLRQVETLALIANQDRMKSRDADREMKGSGQRVADSAGGRRPSLARILAWLRPK